MKKNLFVLIALLLPVCAAQAAQHMDVVPASKGPLPEMPVIEQAEPGHFGGLHLLRTKLETFQSQSWSYEVELQFPTPQTLGGEYYTLQNKRGSDWETITDNGSPVHYTGGSAFAHFFNYSFRLVLHGGDKDGWVSNEVTCHTPAIPTNPGYQGLMNQPTFVGSVIQGTKISARVFNDIHKLSDYTDYVDDPSFVRTWYRCNPNTGAMISTGVHDKNYTVVLDDVGFEIVEVVEGDRVKTDFHYEHTNGIGKFPIQCSAEFFYEGFIINSEYDIPNAQTFFGHIDRQTSESYALGLQPFPAEDFKVLAPGRYAITFPWENYGFGEEIYPTIDHFGLFELWPGSTYQQQFRLWASAGGLETKALQNGTEVEGAKINLLEKNMNGNMQYVYTSTDGYLIAASFITLFAKAVEVGSGNLPTYYPSALLWTDAQSFDAQSMFHSEMGPQPVNIEVRPDFAPLSGQCTIDGKINGTAPVPASLLSPQNPSIIGTWNFYMTDEDGNPIHSSDMLRVQATFNEDGTFVLNIPVWGEVQSGNWSWWTTGQTIQFQVTKVVNGSGTFEGESLVELWGGDPEDEHLKFLSDIYFDGKGNLIMDLFGLPGSVYEPEGGAEVPTAEPVYVYLRQKGGDIVAAALMQADGTYHFEKVPYGTYEVIPNIDGYTVDIQSVTLSAENPTAKSINYAIGQYIITAGEVVGVGTIRTATADANVYYDLSGRRITTSKPARGLYIRNGKKYNY